MRWQVGVASLVVAIALFAAGVFFGSYRQPAEPIHSTASERLQPVATAQGSLSSGATVYVPVYSSMYLGVSHREQTVDLAATVSVRNVSPTHPITLEWVRYYDSFGKRLKDYLDKPSSLPPLGSVEFVIQRADTAGGPGANFLIRWQAPTSVDGPLIEAVMLGQSGNAGISFTSPGRALTSAAGGQ
jgi:hypothetical protein